ncbi:MAG TPA: hypothetical protein VNR51_03740 [Hyphomicrobium sp.]|nr:hypothetical protein [Hyphomicrobium sp.]
MRTLIAGALALGIAVALGATGADAGREYRSYRGGDCKPYNGPFGFYGNIWCQPSEGSYMRNLGAQWPQKTPPSLRNPPPRYGYAYGSDW